MNMNRTSSRLVAGALTLFSTGAFAVNLTPAPRAQPLNPDASAEAFQESRSNTNVEAPVVTAEQGYVGLLLGLSASTDAKASFGYGASIGLRTGQGFGGGLYFLTQTPSSYTATPLTTDEFLAHHFGFEGHYYPASVPGLGVGLRAGFANVRTRVTETANWVAKTKFSGGPTVAYEYPFGSSFAIGAEATYLFVPGDNAFGDFIGGASAKFLF
jgi:hypothetical protein